LLAANGGLDALAAAVADRQTDPYTLVRRLTEPVTSAIDQNNGHE
jgi:hypothetical protein